MLLFNLAKQSILEVSIMLLPTVWNSVGIESINSYNPLKYCLSRQLPTSILPIHVVFQSQRHLFTLIVLEFVANGINFKLLSVLNYNAS